MPESRVASSSFGAGGAQDKADVAITPLHLLVTQI